MRRLGGGLIKNITPIITLNFLRNRQRPAINPLGINQLNPNHPPQHDLGGIQPQPGIHDFPPSPVENLPAPVEMPQLSFSAINIQDREVPIDTLDQEVQRVVQEVPRVDQEIQEALIVDQEVQNPPPPLRRAQFMG